MVRYSFYKSVLKCMAPAALGGRKTLLELT